MSNSDGNSHLFIQSVGIKRTTLVLILTAILTLLGSFTLTIASAWNPPIPAFSQTPHTIIKHSIQLPSSQPRPTPPLPALETQPKIHFLASGNTGLSEIALTFDDGPNPGYTPQVLAILQQYRVKATFFDVGYLVAAYPNLVRQEYKAGHIVGNHTWTHTNLTLLSASQILSQLNSTSNEIQATIGVRPGFFRPPYGLYNYQVLAQANYLGVTTVMWDNNPTDWTRPGADIIVNRVLRVAHNGTVILLHDGGGNRSQTVAALPIIITTLEQRGFQFVTIQQLVDDMYKNSLDHP